ncbi:hypothetical protein L484_025184 [Morus notabilis]|uniref:Uncharacterized protein n=1 Tax=Morus notabilis TaxID=981085 RepID=W9RAT2_9ROSA|nr:hypothetical protein L484_025184 [Morus notabilis]
MKEETFKEAAMNRGKVVNAEGHQRFSLAQRVNYRSGCRGPPTCQPRTEARNSVDWTWEAIKDELKRKLSRSTELVPLAANRAVTWCRDEAERISLLSEKALFYRKFLITNMEL